MQADNRAFGTLLLLLLFMGATSGVLVAAASLDAEQLATMSAQIQGQLIAVPQQGFAYADTLANYLRRGSQLDYQASEPALYLVAEIESDVVHGVRLALEQKMKVAFHGSGHHQAGVSLYPDGITIDVSNLKDHAIDPNTRVARLQVGLTALEVANLTAAHDLHYRVAHANSVGIAGFTLGGGNGWGGITVDQVIAADVVNVWEYPSQELTIKRVDAAHDPELFFALQGAGGMTGAVVAIYAELQPLPPDNLIRSPAVVWPLAQASQAWQSWNSYLVDHTIPKDVELSVTYATIPGKGPVVLWGVNDWTPASSNEAQAREYIDGLLEVANRSGTPSSDSMVPYIETISSLTAVQVYPNVTNYAISQVIPLESMPEASAILTAGYANATTPLSTIVVEFPPEVSPKSNNETAYGWRGYAGVLIWAFWTRTAGGAEVDGDAEHVAWVKGLGAQLEALSLGHYINLADFETPGETQRCFPAANWARVQAAKAQYDPYNLFQELDFFHNEDGRGPLDASSDAMVLAAGGK